MQIMAVVGINRDNEKSRIIRDVRKYGNETLSSFGVRTCIVR
jgi:hypothetical protein